MRKNFSHITQAFMTGLVLWTFSSCEENITPENSSEVQLSIDLPGNLDVETGPWTKADGDYVDASQYEGVRTLRIIVTSGPAESRTILYNQKIDGLENLITYTTTIPDLPHGSLSFYAIANEESLGMEYNDETITSNLAENHKLLFTDNADPKHFPARGPDIVKTGIPMSGYTSVELTGDRSVTIDLYRSVVKLALVVENATNSPVTLRKVSFGEFFGDRYYMFRDLTLDVPDGIQYTGMTYDNLSITIPGTQNADGEEPQTQTLSAYFYPTHPDFTEGNSPFTIGLETNNNIYKPLVFASNTAYFIRNTQVNLRARMTTTMGVQLDFTVLGWDDRPVTVPPFE